MNDELDIVRRVGAGEDLADRAARARVRARVFGGDAPPAASTPRWRRLATVLVPTAAVALGAALVLVLAGDGGDGDFSGGGPTTPAVAAPPSLFPQPDQFLYVRSEGQHLVCVEREGGPDCGPAEMRRREVWVSDRQSGRIVETGRPGGGPPIRLGRVRLQLGNRSFTRAQLARYRPTGRRLLADLRRGRVPGQGNGGASYPFTQLTDALREVPMPAHVRAAIIEALSLVPGVVDGGETTDGRGRHGLRFSRVAEGQREVVIVDPVTLTMLEERTFVTDPSILRGAYEKGDMIGSATYVERAIVGRVGVRP